MSRGKTCRFGQSAGQNGRSDRTAAVADRNALPSQQQQQSPLAIPAAVTIPPLASPEATSVQAHLLEELQSLKKLASDLERRVFQTTGLQDDCHGDSVGLSRPPGASQLDAGIARPSSLDQVKEVVAHLERVSMVQSAREPIDADGLVFKIERIRNISRTPSYTVQSGKTVRCIWLPRHEEARALLDKFITDVSYILQVVHHPSLSAIIDDIYRQVENEGTVKPGHLVLLLSVIAITTEVWTQSDDVRGDGPLFPSSAHANSQTSMWIKETIDVLNGGQNGPALALETIQGIIILSFVLSNLEGVSLRYRSLISTGLLLSRELGLHRIDHESNAATANTTQAEIGRRVWWMLAARYGGPGEGVYQVNPRHMIVKKPRNINDVDLVDNGPQLELPISQPTDMSYFLQRIRLAEISRSIVDHNPMAVISFGGLSYYAHVIAMDFELSEMINNIPSFFHLDRYEANTSSMSSGIFIQAYLLNSVIHTQRCKLHLRYLTSGPNNNPNYASSRATCLTSARQLIRAEAQLERAQHPFVLIRLRLSGMLYGVFLASIALLMDAYINGAGSLQDEIRRGDVAEALRIVEGARSHSWAAANLHESLMQVLAKYRAQQPQQRQQSQQQMQQHMQMEPTPRPMTGVSTASSAPAIDAATGQSAQLSDQPAISSALRGLDSGNPMPDQMSAATTSQAPYYNQLAESLEELMYTDGFQWDDLFSGIDSVSFF
ncbi:predicted protein [Uncinocarpus reesii 1704]|uniref:Transcription factor domain-containing protein n=1 Tax=Uncinocarpus reesii (strain UAMH 1704) TaxID=336963 RepID=C4JVA8_UNCRE|nr:uncharacterized protein UREG_06500 [Uncinocarpus reesii 1704]EEP81635.1 predicted protein [Uncinocarpus reesii 1704]